MQMASGGHYNVTGEFKSAVRWNIYESIGEVRCVRNGLYDVFINFKRGYSISVKIGSDMACKSIRSLHNPNYADAKSCDIGGGGVSAEDMGYPTTDCKRYGGMEQLTAVTRDRFGNRMNGGDNFLVRLMARHKYVRS